MNLLSISNDAKTAKGEPLGYLTAIQYFAPSTVAGGRNLCPFASKGCLSACLYTAGRGAFNSVQKARIERTQYFLSDFEQYRSRLLAEIVQAKAKADKRNLKLAVRLNGTSDIDWTRMLPTLFAMFPDVSFYDYTKSEKRVLTQLDTPSFPNYSLTFSRSETNNESCKRILAKGGTVAVVFRNSLPTEWQGFPVISGDDSDLRFLDPKGHVIGLIAKGFARKDVSGFVVD